MYYICNGKPVHSLPKFIQVHKIGDTCAAIDVNHKLWVIIGNNAKELKNICDIEQVFYHKSGVISCIDVVGMIMNIHIFQNKMNVYPELPYIIKTCYRVLLDKFGNIHILKDGYYQEIGGLPKIIDIAQMKSRIFLLDNWNNMYVLFENKAVKLELPKI